MNRCRNWSAASAGTMLSAACGAAPAHFSVQTDATNGCYAVGATATVTVAVAESGRRTKDKKLLLVPGLGHRWLKDTDFERWLFAVGSRP